MPDICDFASELGKAGSSFRARWMKDKNKESRMQVASDFGLAGEDLKICKKALDDNSSKPIEDHCGKKGTWVK